MPFASRTRVGPGKHLLQIVDRFEANTVLCLFNKIQPSSLRMYQRIIYTMILIAIADNVCWQTVTEPHVAMIPCDIRERYRVIEQRHIKPNSRKVITVSTLFTMLLLQSGSFMNMQRQDYLNRATDRFDTPYCLAVHIRCCYLFINVTYYCDIRFTLLGRRQKHRVILDATIKFIKSKK